MSTSRRPALTRHASSAERIVAFQLRSQVASNLTERLPQLQVQLRDCLLVDPIPDPLPPLPLIKRRV